MGQERRPGSCCIDCQGTSEQIRVITVFLVATARKHCRPKPPPSRSVHACKHVQRHDVEPPHAIALHRPMPVKQDVTTHQTTAQCGEGRPPHLAHSSQLKTGPGRAAVAARPCSPAPAIYLHTNEAQGRANEAARRKGTNSTAVMILLPLWRTHQRAAERPVDAVEGDSHRQAAPPSARPPQTPQERCSEGQRGSRRQTETIGSRHPLRTQRHVLQANHKAHNARSAR